MKGFRNLLTFLRGTSNEVNGKETDMDERSQDTHDAPGHGRPGGIDDPTPDREYGDGPEEHEPPEEYAVENTDGDHIGTYNVPGPKEAAIAAAHEEKSHTYYVTDTLTGTWEQILHTDIEHKIEEVVPPEAMEGPPHPHDQSDAAYNRNRHEDEPDELGGLHPPATEEEKKQIDQTLTEYMESFDGSVGMESCVATATLTVQVPVTVDPQTSIERQFDVAESQVLGDIRPVVQQIADVEVVNIAGTSDRDLEAAEEPEPDYPSVDIGDEVDIFWDGDVGQVLTGEVIALDHSCDPYALEVDLFGEGVVKVSAATIEDHREVDDADLPDHEVFG